MANKSKKQKITVGKLIIEIFDSMFIMILCFITLLAAMLLQGADTQVEYVIDIKSLSITVLGFVVYMVFILSQSNKGLKDMINHIYSNKEAKEANIK